ncbi:FAD-binding protein [Chromobacterium alticapitis]|uniref:FAD-binding protein n=1 Tax=Chromobacterium alticapitis TaxID=2073169 RepID=UPI0018ECC10A|nr:FAD-binding protein [Chromobacterium alticapitis]
MSYQVITHDDARYETLKKGFNLRWPADGQQAGAIIVCRDADEARQALQYAVDHGKRPTIRSGGHCYEGFVSNNRDGIILDIGPMSGLLNDVHAGGHRYGFQLLAGNQNWDGYVGLYKLHGKTIPGGSCYSVGAGGHISGGGYGLLSRMHGLTVDWLSAVDILLVDEKRKVHLVHAREDNGHADLLRLCRGGGGGNAGLITSYYFDDMPPAPRLVALQFLEYDWAQLRHTPAMFADLLHAYGEYWAEADRQSDGYGLFSLLKLNHVSTGKIGLVVQYTDENGRLDDTGPLVDFNQRMSQACLPQPLSGYLAGGSHLPFVPHRSIHARHHAALPPHTQVMDIRHSDAERFRQQPARQIQVSLYETGLYRTRGERHLSPPEPGGSDRRGSQPDAAASGLLRRRDQPRRQRQQRFQP